MYSGRVRKEFKGEVIYGQYVHVFDWSGKFRRAYDLDEAVFRVDIDPSGQRLYTLVHEPKVGVVMFDLSIDASAS